MRPHRLLLIDTDSKSAAMMQAGLAEAGLQVAVAIDIDSARDHLERSAPDLILTHTRLPDMLGFRLVEEVRKESKWSHIPVLLLSGDVRLIGEDSSRPDVEDYLIKPLDVKDVVARVQVLLRKAPRDEQAAAAASATKASDSSITMSRGAEAATADTQANAPVQAGPSLASELAPPPSSEGFQTLDYAFRNDEPAARVTWAPKGRRKRKATTPGQTLRGVSDDSRNIGGDQAGASAAEEDGAQTAVEAAPRSNGSEIPESRIQERSPWIAGTGIGSPSTPPEGHPTSNILRKDEASAAAPAAKGVLRASTHPHPEGAAQARALVEAARVEIGLTIVDKGVPDASLRSLEAREQPAHAAAPKPASRRTDGPLASAFPLLLSDLPADAPISIVPYPSDLRLLRDPRLRTHSPFPRDPRIPSDPRAVLTQPPIIVVSDVPPALSDIPPGASAAPFTESMMIADEPTRSKPVLPPNPRIPSNPVLPPNPRVPSNPAGSAKSRSVSIPADELQPPAEASEPAAESPSIPGSRGKRKRRRLRSLGFTAVSRPLLPELTPDQATPAQGVPMPMLEKGMKRRPEVNNLATVRPPPGLMLQIPMDALRSLPPEEGEEIFEPAPPNPAPIIVNMPARSTDPGIGGQTPRRASLDEVQANAAAAAAVPAPKRAVSPSRALPAVVIQDNAKTPAQEGHALVDSPTTLRPEGAQKPSRSGRMIEVSTTWRGPSGSGQRHPRAPEPPRRSESQREARLPSTMPPEARTGLFVNTVLAVVAIALVLLLGVLLAQHAAHTAVRRALQAYPQNAPAAQPQSAPQPPTPASQGERTP